VPRLSRVNSSIIVRILKDRLSFVRSWTKSWVMVISGVWG